MANLELASLFLSLPCLIFDIVDYELKLCIVQVATIDDECR